MPENVNDNSQTLRWDANRRRSLLASRTAIVLSIGSAILIVLHLMFGILKPRLVGPMAVGIAFWLLIAYGYVADAKEREQNRDES
jgi:hypothetical protein